MILSQFSIQKKAPLDSEGHNFVNTMKRLGIERDSIQVVDDQISSPTWAPLLADGLLCAIAEEQDLSGLYHYAHDNECSWKNFAELIALDKIAPFGYGYGCATTIPYGGARVHASLRTGQGRRRPRRR